jgi:hypothetical protein
LQVKENALHTGSTRSKNEGSLPPVRLRATRVLSYQVRVPSCVVVPARCRSNVARGLSELVHGSDQRQLLGFVAGDEVPNRGPLVGYWLTRRRVQSR